MFMGFFEKVCKCTINLHIQLEYLVEHIRIRNGNEKNGNGEKLGMG